jgi:hypothetical protein
MLNVKIIGKIQFQMSQVKELSVRVIGFFAANRLLDLKSFSAVVKHNKALLSPLSRLGRHTLRSSRPKALRYGSILYVATQ